MDRNENIIEKWEPIHERGIFAYVIPYSLHFFLKQAAIVIAVILINRTKSMEVICYAIAFNMLFFTFVVFLRVFEWLRKEKQYKDILELFEMADKCPACSAITTSEDKVCPSCGTLLKIDE